MKYKIVKVELLNLTTSYLERYPAKGIGIGFSEEITQFGNK